MDMRFKFRAVNVPENLTHKSRKEEIEDLPNYLELTSTAADNLLMVVKSMSEPDTTMRQHMWLKVDGVGAPLGLYCFYNGAWTAIP